MRVVFVSSEADAVRLISRSVLSEGGTSRFFSDAFEFFGVFGEKKIDADIILFDYRFFHLCKFFFFRSLRDSGMKIPFIFYNDPFCERKSRVVYWVRRNENFFGGIGFEYLVPFLTRVASALDDASIHPFVAKFQTRAPSAAFKEAEHRGKSRAEPVSSRRHLSPALFNLLSYFMENEGREISLSELVRADGGAERESTVYSYISRLRKAIASTGDFRIVRTGKGTYRLFTAQKKRDIIEP